MDMEASYGDCQLVRRSKQTFFMDLPTRRWFSNKCVVILLMVQKSCDHQLIWQNICKYPIICDGFDIHPRWWSLDFWTINNRSRGCYKLGRLISDNYHVRLCEFWERFQTLRIFLRDVEDIPSWGLYNISLPSWVKRTFPARWWWIKWMRPWRCELKRPMVLILHQ